MMKVKNRKRRKAVKCTYFNNDSGVCSVGMPVVNIFAELICSRKPEKCPIFLDVFQVGKRSCDEGAIGRN